MGSCQSAPSNNVDSRGVPAGGKSAIVSDTAKLGSKSVGAKDSRGRNHAGDPSETECDTTVDLSSERHDLVPERHEARQSTPPRGGTLQEESSEHSSDIDITEGRSPVYSKPGYASGGSSSESDDPFERSSSTRSSHLIDLKRTLSPGGDVCKGVVRIETDYGRPIEEIYEGVHDGPVLGAGVAGMVRQVKHRKTGVNYAVKCLDLDLIGNERGQRALRDEVSTMCQLDHPNIVRLEEVYESDSEIYLIQQLCTGGDLFDRLDEQSDFHYSEVKCAKLVKQMLSAIRYMHSKKIIHRDLKLENFLFSSADPNSELKMIDFGLSKHFTHAGEMQNECVGTPYIVAPEIIHAQYNEKADIWALGVITFLLLSGETPFGGVDGENLTEIRDNILEGECRFEPAELWEHVSNSGKAFVKRLLNPDASKRPSAKEAQRDQWLQTYGKRDAKAEKNLNPKVCQALVEFKEYSDMRKVLCEVLSFTLLPEQIADLRLEFEKADPEGEGEISFSALKQVLRDSAEAGALGALTETEVEEIFNALRVRKTETKIRWHEFIAAGLSCCNFDDRNLKLAFDRLDYDRKGFITIDDMKELLGTTGEEDEELKHMWQDGISELVCPLGRITYEDFLMFVKGQKRESKEPSSPVARHRSKRIESPLQSVPEGSVSPQAKQHTFTKFDQLSTLDSLQMPFLGGLAPPLGGLAPPLGGLTPPLGGLAPPLSGLAPPPLASKPREVDIGMPVDRPVNLKMPPKRTRSKSLGEAERREIEKFEYESESDDELLNPTCVVLPSKAIGELQRVIGDETNTGLVVHKALYTKHREFRRSVLEASKLFDQKHHAMKLQIHLSRRDNELGRASLVMKRGELPPRGSGAQVSSDHPLHSMGSDGLNDSDSAISIEGSEHEKDRVADAVKRSGRPRRRRKKTASDLSGMLR